MGNWLAIEFVKILPFEWMQNKAKSWLGITDAELGMEGPTATEGRQTTQQQMENNILNSSGGMNGSLLQQNTVAAPILNSTTKYNIPNTVFNDSRMRSYHPTPWD